MTTLPYRATTSTGDVFDIAFPLHEQTVDPVRVQQMVSTVLEAIDRDVMMAGDTSNGDVLQALAMAFAIRAGMIHASSEVTGRLAQDLLASALRAMAAADRSGVAAGHA